MKNFFTILILLTLAGCKKDPEPVVNISTRTAVLNNIGDNLIVGNFVALQSSANGLAISVDNYISD